MPILLWLPLNSDLTNNGFDQSAKLTSSATYTKGLITPKAYYCNTQSSVAKFSKLNGISKYTITYWVYINSKASFTSYADMWGVQVRVGSTITYMRDELRATEGYRSVHMAKDVSVGNTSASYYGLGDRSDAMNKWCHVAIVKDDTNVKQYVNGELISTTACSNFESSPGELTGNVYIGQLGCQAYLNDFRIYSHCLSIMEIQQIAMGLSFHMRLAGPGAPNILSSAPKLYNSSAYNAYQLILEENLQAEQTYTLQLWDVNVSHTGKTVATLGVSVYWGGGSVKLVDFIGANYFTDGHADRLIATFTPTSSQASGSGASNRWLNIYNSPTSVSGTMSMSIGKWKLEKTANPTPWSPTNAKLQNASGSIIQNSGGLHIETTSSPEYNYMGFSDLTEYDCSGYMHNGQRSTTGIIKWDGDSARYNSCYLFSGNSYINCGNPANIIADGAKEFTINIWGCRDTWQDTWRLYSCTESGGFNIEGTTDVINFPVHVYTKILTDSSGNTVENSRNEPITLGTSSSYISNSITNNLASGWHMFTHVYNTSGSKVYIDGELVKTVTSTSYGVHFHGTTNLFIGCESVGTNPGTPYFNGKISDFRIYGRELESGQIKKLYNLGGSLDNKGVFHTYEYVEG